MSLPRSRSWCTSEEKIKVRAESKAEKGAASANYFKRLATGCTTRREFKTKVTPVTFVAEPIGRRLAS